MQYCKRCILPDTRPGITLDSSGICSGCRGHDRKLSEIDWPKREDALQHLASEARQRAEHGYDCIVPVSGGKDSWYQVAVAKNDLNLNVLGITWKTPGRTELGQRNLDALIARLGIDHIDYSIALDVERRFMTAAFERKGATAIPMHMAIFAIPMRLAVQFKIPLVLWGENPQLEFGGNREEQLSTVLDDNWIRKHGVSNRTEVEDWIGCEELNEADLSAYRLPMESSFQPKSIFLGAYRRWSSFKNAAVAKSLGFEEAESTKVGTWSFADIDCHFISIHHFLKWYKFGITRAFDNLSVQIREGLIDRERAIAQIAEVGIQTPSEDIRRFCEFVGKPETWFWETAEQFRNTEIWKLDDRGRWFIPDFLLDRWDFQP